MKKYLSNVTYTNVLSKFTFTARARCAFCECMCVRVCETQTHQIVKYACKKCVKMCVSVRM
jgi:hypothetical protein